MENPIKMDDLGVPLFLETSISVSKKTCDPLVFSEVSASAEGVKGRVEWIDSGV